MVEGNWKHTLLMKPRYAFSWGFSSYCQSEFLKYSKTPNCGEADSGGADPPASSSRTLALVSDSLEATTDPPQPAPTEIGTGISGPLIRHNLRPGPDLDMWRPLCSVRVESPNFKGHARWHCFPFKYRGTQRYRQTMKFPWQLQQLVQDFICWKICFLIQPSI